MRYFFEKRLGTHLKPEALWRSATAAPPGQCRNCQPLSIPPDALIPGLAFTPPVGRNAASTNTPQPRCWRRE